MNFAPVNKIIPFSNVDGPGNRTSIFLQSCPFRCLYCHNPETIQLCIHCGECVKTCPVKALKLVKKKVVWDQQKCVNCDTCIKTCKQLSSPKVSMLSTDDVLKAVLKQEGFIRGITVSGGECMNHADFLLELFVKVKSYGLTCLIDSNGCHDFTQFPELVDVCDGVMLDVKATDSTFHIQLTSISNDVVIKNLLYLLQKDKLEEVRTVLLPAHQVENEKTVRQVSQWIQDKTTYKLLRYRPFGVRQEGIEKIGNTTTTEEEANHLCEIAKKLGATKTMVI